MHLSRTKKGIYMQQHVTVIDYWLMEFRFQFFLCVLIRFVEDADGRSEAGTHSCGKSTEAVKADTALCCVVTESTAGSDTHTHKHGEVKNMGLCSGWLFLIHTINSSKWLFCFEDVSCQLVLIWTSAQLWAERSIVWLCVVTKGGKKNYTATAH